MLDLALGLGDQLSGDILWKIKQFNPETELNSYFQIAEGLQNNDTAILNAYNIFTPSALGGFFSKDRLDALFLQAAATGHIAWVTKLLEAGADVNTQDGYGQVALTFAIVFNNMPMIQLLIEYGANPTIKNSEGNTSLEYALDLDNDTPNPALIELLQQAAAKFRNNEDI